MCMIIIKAVFNFARHYFISPLSLYPAERPERLLHDPPDFEQCDRLQQLLIHIQHHIVESITTQQCYVAICEDIKHELQDGTLTVDVSVDDVKAHFSSMWPKFVPMNPRFMRYKDEMRWGRVGKGCDDGNDSNEIELDPDLVRGLEAAPEGSDLLVYLKTILIVTIFHELMHHLTKSVFSRQLTPPGVGPSSISGEAGEALEERLFAGVVCVIWDKGETAEMEKIQHLVLDYRGSLRDLSINKCQLLIESISTSQIAKFQFSKLKGHITKQGTERHRIVSPISRTEPYPPPDMVITHRCRGLGIDNLDNIIARDKHIKYVAC